MSARVWILSLLAVLAQGCHPSAPVAQATPPPALAVAAAAPEVEPETTVTPEPAPARDAAPATAEPEVEPETGERTAEPAPAAPAAFATTQATTAPALQPVVVVPTTTAALDPAPAPAPSPATPKTAAEVFDAQLAALIRNEPPLVDAADVADDDRQLLQSVIDSLTSFRMTLRSGAALRPTKVAPLIDLSEKIRSEIPLSLPTLALCRSVQQYGVYDPIEPARFTAGRETPVVVYCEVDHFRSAPAADDRWETRLTYEAVLYSDGQSGIPVINKKATPIVDRCRNRRRDFFLADRMSIPANLPVGKYVLKVTVIDQLANQVAEKTVPVLVAPN